MIGSPHERSGIWGCHLARSAPDIASLILATENTGYLPRAFRLQDVDARAGKFM